MTRPEGKDTILHIPLSLLQAFWEMEVSSVPGHVNGASEHLAGL